MTNYPGEFHTDVEPEEMEEPPGTPPPGPVITEDADDNWAPLPIPDAEEDSDVVRQG